MNKFKTEIKWGLIFTCGIMLWMLLERLMGLHSTHIDKHATYSNLFAIVAVVIYVFALRDKRDQDFSGKMTYWQGLKSGVIISIIVGLLTPGVQLVSAFVISPHYFENAIRHGVANGLATLPEAEAYFNVRHYILVSTISAPMMGVVTSAVVAFFLKSKPEVTSEA
ncbi:MAG: DUF4199 domain-containing protein [Candidatus Marinimicrobia bacterium]|nr:DUF4199 domain-containing protein [Candidatus Neomarinimicrobiota bacterium]MCF7921470.1 DUF4199 domain-containing protein [Candidatus Neomarinimicrobiota bacterium]